MTVVVAVEHRGGVVLACDSYLGSTSTSVGYPREKWFAYGESVLAFAGTLRPVQIVEHHAVRITRRTREPLGTYAVRVADAIRRAHKDHGIEESQNEATFLLVSRGRACVVTDSYSVVESSTGYYAIGAGEDHALGALAALDGVEAEARARRACEAAVRHCAHCAAPVRVRRV